MVELLLLVLFLVLNNGNDDVVSAFVTIQYPHIRINTPAITTTMASLWSSSSNHHAVLFATPHVKHVHWMNHDSTVKNRHNPLNLYPQSQLHQLTRPTSSMMMLLRMMNHENDPGTSTTTTTATNSSRTPSIRQSRNIQIEYCPGCKWHFRAHWMAQELLYHYNNNVLLVGGDGMVTVTILPSTIAGTFRIIQIRNNDREDDDDDNNIDHTTTTMSNISTGPLNDAVTIWDRTIDTGFPEMEDLYERINRSDSIPATMTTTTSTNDSTDSSAVNKMTTSITTSILPQPHISIVYRSPHDLFRASYIGQEILSTFSEEVKAVSFRPKFTNGVATTDVPPPAVSQILIRLNDNVTIYSYLSNNGNSETNRFIPIKALKQLIRDQINPTKHLGHSDVVVGTTTTTNVMDATAAEENDAADDDDDDDDSAAELARNYFGVA